MRIFKAILSVALALAVHGVHAVTGPAAAELITSDASTVNYETPENFLLQFQRIQNGTVYDLEYSVKDVSEVEEVFVSLSGKITAQEAMLNAMKALANVEVLHETDTWLGKRIDALEKSAKAALAKVDKTEVVDKHGNQIESILKIIEKPESGSETIKVTTEGTPVDDMSLSFTGKPKGPKTPAPLEIKGFGANANNPWLIPHPRDGAMHWGHVAMLADRKSIEATYGSTDVFSYTFGLKGWDAPQAGAAKCDDSLSSQLLTGDKTHYVLTKLGDALHYTPVGKLAVMSPDGKSVVTNETADGSASVAGAAGATQGFVPYSDGNGGFAWDYATPTVAWDDSTDTLTVTTPREDDETKTVVFPRISVEKEDGEDSTTYTVTWRDLNGEQTEETEISVPKASAVSPDGATVVTNATGHANEAALKGFWDPGTKDGHFPVKSGDALVWVPTNAQESASAAVDGVTIVTNAPGHANEAALKGFWDPGTKDGHFPVKVGNSLTWMPTNVVSVTTNKVDGDKVTITSTEANGENTLGLKDWNANYGGSFPLFLVNDHGALGYYPLPEPITNLTKLAQCDMKSLATNNVDALEICGWKSQAGCGTDAATILGGTDTENHQIVTRVGGANGELHYLPFGIFPHPSAAEFTVNSNTKEFTIKGTDGKFLKGTAQGGVEWADVPTNGVDRASIILTDGIASLNGFAGADPDMVPFKDSSGNLAWREHSPVAVDMVSVTTNQSREITLKGYADAEVGSVPQKTENGLEWLKSSSATNVLLAGAGINITDNGGGAITISAQAMTPESGGEVTVSVVTDARYDPATHKFQVKRRQLVFTGSLGPESAWTDVFETVSHQSEHEIEEH